MNRECIQEAPTVEEAVDAALEQLGVQQDAVEYEVLEEPGKKVFGVGSSRPAKVRVWVKPEVAAELEQGVDEEVQEDDEVVPPELMADAVEAELSDEELDKIADAAVGALKTVLGPLRDRLGDRRRV